MPIRRENRDRYPKHWKSLRAEILTRASHRCENCGAENYQPHPITGSKVILTIAHLNHQPEDCDPENLRAWCQKCHNTYDAPYRLADRRQRLAEANANKGIVSYNQRTERN